MLKRFGLPLLALLAVCGFALNAADSEIEQLKKMIQAQNAKIEKLEKAQGASASTAMVDKAVASRGACYLAPDQPELKKGTGLFVDASFLYMTAATDQQVVAFTGYGAGTAPFVSSQNPVGEQEQNEFDYTPAFRVGLGYRLPYSGWDIEAEYTHFETDGDLSLFDNNTADPTYVIEDVTMNPNAAPASATNVRSMQSKESINYDTLDFMLGQNSKLTERFAVRFQAGFSMLKYGHDLEVESQGVTILGLGHRYSNDQDFTGYGLKVGLEGNFDVGHGFGVYGAGDGVMYAGEHESRIYDQVDNTGNPAAPFGPADVRNSWRRSSDALIPGIQGSAGVTYSHRFGEFLNLKIKLGYEFNHYFGLNRTVINVNNAVHPPERSNSDVTIHGMVLNFKFDF